MSNKQIDRRAFLKSAAAVTAAAAAITTRIAASAEAAQTTATETESKETVRMSEKIIARPGSDFMVDVIKATGIEYIASNPGSSFRSLQESIVNYGGNKNPEFLTCMHEESSVAMAHGYAKAAGQAHGNLGPWHRRPTARSDGGIQCLCDRVPVMIFAGNFLDADKRRPGVEWYHCVQDPAAMLRDFTKWDDQPASLQHFAESVMRGYKLATTPPMEPVVITADGYLQEAAIQNEKKLHIPKLTRSIPPQGDSGAVAEAAKMLVEAERPVIIADRMARSQEGVKRLAELAEALYAPVIDLGGRMNFPTTHYLSRSGDRRALVGEADVALLLEVGDPWGQFNTVSDPHHEYRRLAKPDVKVIHISLSETLTKSNYQDMQRFMPVDLAIFGDAQSTLPSLTEAVKSATSSARRGALANRTDGMRNDHRRMKERSRNSASQGWNTSPVTTARLAAEMWNVIKRESWCATGRQDWARSLWPAGEYYNFNGGSGGAAWATLPRQRWARRSPIATRGSSPSTSSRTVT